MRLLTDEENHSVIEDEIDLAYDLGDPGVVRELVNGFCNVVYEWMKSRGDGSMSKAEFTKRLREIVNMHSDIVMGRESDVYRPVVGWHCKQGLGIAIKQVIGPFWEKYQGEYDNDPGKALFGWLAASLVDSSLKAISEDEPDLHAALFAAKKDDVVELLLGLQKRR